VNPEPFGDIPLFREIQRLLASSGEGPINLEVASQVAGSVATENLAETPVTSGQQKILSDAVHESETLLAGYTRLALAEPLSGQAVTRSQWASQTLRSWRWMLERLATRFIDDLSSDTAGDESMQQMQLVMKQVGPLLMGLQAGTLVGHLAREVVSGFDPSIPREGEKSVLLVISNIQQIARDYGLDEDTTIRWVAVQDVARQLVVQGVSWVAPYRRNLMTSLIDSIEIDASELQGRLVDLQSMGLEALQEGAAVDASIPLVPTEAHRQALDRVKAFVGLHEGYATKATIAVGEAVITDPTRISEVIARRRASPSDAKEMLSSVLGFSLDRDLVTTGTTFCSAIEQLEGLPALNQAWAAPDNLPTYAELKDPFLWIDRVLEG
jgi:putative hydrolase